MEHFDLYNSQDKKDWQRSGILRHKLETLRQKVIAYLDNHTLEEMQAEEDTFTYAHFQKNWGIFCYPSCDSSQHDEQNMDTSSNVARDTSDTFF